MALLDAFFISLVALVPGSNIGSVAVVVGCLALVNTLSLGRHLWEDQHHKPMAQGLILLVGGVAIYVYQIGLGVALLQNDRDMPAVRGLTYLLLGSYSLGVTRTWSLLGGDRETFLSLLGLVAVGADAHPDAPTEDHTRGGEAAPLPLPADHQAPE
jgi:hypothetical protein